MELLRRTLDVAVALPMLAAALPVLALNAASIRACSRGPIFYVQARPGRASRSIRVYKLRTLHLDGERRLARYLARHPEHAQAWQRENYLAHDPRIAGAPARFARRFGIDELPQLWNVLRGDMTLVGPRPIERKLLETLFSERERTLRQRVTPGLTGLWQVRRRVASTLSLRRYDMFYLRRRSLAFDLWILLQTPRALVRGAGA
jgi:lipopolysaccharide/colanic/teichoic acid biosynthesis glycosyltransferase